MRRWWGMAVTATRLVGAYWYAPWKSPLLRWRMETYGITDERGRLLQASEITPRRFIHFSWTHRRTLCRFLQWAAALSA